jgi:creatinine amidohydrolase
MNWENLTSIDFEKAVRETGVCIIAFGVLERHGDHLPLGTDFLNGHKIATAAAELEKAVVFPPFYFGQIYEARCFPGTIAIKPTLLLELIQGVLDEVGRNGFKKIILFNAHGGNDFLLKFLAQCQLWKELPYQVYLYLGDPSAEYDKHFKDICETKLHGHACECETSISLYHHPELVRMENLSPETAYPEKKLAHISNLFTGLSWYSNYPHHYVGNANCATAEKGKELAEMEVRSFARFIEAVKKDEVLPELSRQFHSQTEYNK